MSIGGARTLFYGMLVRTQISTLSLALRMMRYQCSTVKHPSLWPQYFVRNLPLSIYTPSQHWELHWFTTPQVYTPCVRLHPQLRPLWPEAKKQFTKLDLNSRVGATIPSRLTRNNREKFLEGVETAMRQRMRTILGHTDGDTEVQAIEGAPSSLSVLKETSFF